MKEESGAPRDRTGAGACGMSAGSTCTGDFGVVVGTGLRPAEEKTCSPSSPPRLRTRTAASTQKPNFAGIPGVPSARAAARSRGAAACPAPGSGPGVDGLSAPAWRVVHRTSLQPGHPALERGNGLWAECRTDHVTGGIEEVGHRQRLDEVLRRHCGVRVDGRRGMWRARRTAAGRPRLPRCRWSRRPAPPPAPCFARATVATAVSSARQSRHHEAKKFTTTGLPWKAESETRVPTSKVRQ